MGHSASGKVRIRNREQAELVLELRRAGLSYREISAALKSRKGADGQPDPVLLSAQRCHQIVSALLAEMTERVTEKAEDVRRLEVDRLDGILSKLWPGRGNPRVADSILRTMERRAKLLGLDAPPEALPERGLDLSKLTTDELHALLTLTEKARRGEAAEAEDVDPDETEH